nr:hypothetical protein [Bacillota bacterium]
PFFIGTQFHPEFRSRPNRPHPLFAGFVGAALEYRRKRQAEVGAGAPGAAAAGPSSPAVDGRSRA